MSHKKRTAKAAVVKSPVSKKMEVKDNSPYVFQRDKLGFDLIVRDLPWTQKQKDIINLINDKNTRIVFISGPAGTSKSILATYCALKLLAEKKVSEIIYIRSVIESASKSLGFLPGEAGDKMKPFAMPLVDKMEELIKEQDIKKLVQEERVKPIPINFLRGASFNVNFIIADEMQNAEFSEIQTIITRIGSFSKFVFCGDPMQTDLKEKGKSGFKPMFDIFNNEESRAQGIFCVELDKEDIMRSGILKFIVEKLQIYKK
jgi:phosphate starvation-inducible PhoH-like protein